MSTQPAAFPWPSPDVLMRQWQELLGKMAATPKVMQAIQRVRVGATPSRPVYREDNLRLLEFESEQPRRFKTPVLFVFALVNRPYILDLRPGKSVVSHFVRHGFPTYKVDWGTPTSGDRFLGIEDYVLGYLDHCVDAIRRRNKVEKISLMGYCMGGTLSGMYAALRPDKVQNLMLMAAPFDWSTRDNLLSIWTQEKYFDVDKMLEVYGNAPPHWLQSSFLMLKPVQNLFEKYLTFYENMQDEKFLDDFMAMETWLNDNIPVAGETFRQFVKYCFQQNLLIQGKLEVGPERVDLRNIRCPVLNIVASQDHLVSPEQSFPLTDKVGSTDRQTMTLPAGHIGLAVGSRAHRELWPNACDWLAQRSEPV